MAETEICIIGAGVMGSSAAYHLSKTTSKQILLIDQYGIPNEFCSSNDTNRVFRYAYGGDVFYTGLAIESRKKWQALEKESSTQLLVPVPLLLVQGNNEERNEFNIKSHKTLKNLGLDSEELDKTELRKCYPQFHANSAYTDPYAGALLAGEALTTFIDQAKKRQVKTLENTQITKIDTTHDRIVLTSQNGRNIGCKKLLVTTGPWTNKLTDHHLTKITSTRQQLIYFQPENLRIYKPPNFPVFFMDQYYGIPAVGIDAVKISHIGRDTPADPDTGKRTIDEEEVQACRNVLKEYIPDLASASLARSKVCFYDMSPDTDFVIGHDPENRNIVYGYGFSGHGFKFAPVIGELLTSLVLDNKPTVDLARFTPERPSYPEDK